MFGRRRHAAAVRVAPAPQLTEAQILELVHSKVSELIGEKSEWSVSRRFAEDTDTIFHAVLSQTVSLGITAAIVDAKRRIKAGETVTEPAAPQHVASDDLPEVPASAESPEPVAFSWEPAPITVWTDLRKPVTGEIPAIMERAAA